VAVKFSITPGWKVLPARAYDPGRRLAISAMRRRAPFAAQGIHGGKGLV
jgi:hypothetical protein